MATYKRLDETGLGLVWAKIKAIIPTKTTDLTNDAGFITSSAIANKANLSNGYVDDSELLSAATLAKWQAILS